MRAGILAGLTWAIETMLLSGALNLPFFAKNLQLAFLAPFICAFLHDSCSSLLLAGQGAWRAWQRQYWWIVLAAAIGGVKPSHALQIRQTASAIVSGLLLLALLPAGIFFHPPLGQGRLWLFIAFASAFATVSYLFYYKAIDQLGPSKAMALNVTSSAWAYLFTVFSGQWDLVNGKSLYFALLVFAGSILTAGDWQELFKRGDQ